MNTEKYAVYVIWGESPEHGSKPSVYEFNTEAERQAFLLGVDEMNGWLDYNLVDHENYVVNEDGEIEEVSHAK